MRIPRSSFIDQSSGIYHVVCRGNNKADIFHDEEDFMEYKEILRGGRKKYPFTLYHYTFMSNHVHLALEPSESISKSMQWINHSYSIYCKKKYDKVGHLWQERFFSKPITTDQYLLACGVYIALNPVRAGIVRHPEKYQWSSFAAFAKGGFDPDVNPDPAYLGLSTDEEERRRMYMEIIEMWLEKPVSREEARRFFRRGPKSNHPLH